MKSMIPLCPPLTHKQKVLKLYKEILRNLESWYHYRPVFRYQATLMRARFDENKRISKAQGADLLCEAEKELREKEHYAVKQFPNTIRGIAYMRQPHIPDWVLDYWHPCEKAQFPEYFRRREQRKDEYINMWENKYGPLAAHEDHDH